MDLSHIDFRTTRHDRYTEYEDMFNCYEDEMLIVRNLERINPYIAISLPYEVAMLYSDLAFSYPINAFTKDNPEADKAIDELIDDNNLDTQLSETAISLAYKGDAIFKNYMDKGKSKITTVNPEFYFPKFSPTDKRKLLSETIAYPYMEGNKEYLYTETYEPDENGDYWFISQTYFYKRGTIGKPIGEEIKVNTKLKKSPLTHVPFTRSGNNFWGDSIYKPLTPLFDEFNHRVTEISAILDKHSDPNMIGDPSFFDENNELPMGGKGFPVEQGEQKPEYITWDWSGQWNFKFIEEIIFKALQYVSPLAPALYGLDNASQASGRALTVKSWRSQCKIKRSHNYWRAALKEILFKAQQLEVLNGIKDYTPAIPNIELVINIPIDHLEMSQAEQLKVQSKVTSIKSSISRLNPHLTSKQIEEEYLDMINEQAEIDNLLFTRRE
ncbi:phage portal protein [Schinkia azotoformans]|uniref:phage portal protein n=1 Tax=Schinkia azotoformans TaxID=1454 RepID=UPI002DB916A1|nr:phage portal protein [Schinkia azotoformans]MEC1786077.1 phage portal protein [Schinkia azotoformans]MED4420113.1 phage portal protein [Schinkia azotoformans]